MGATDGVQGEEAAVAVKVKAGGSLWCCWSGGEDAAEVEGKVTHYAEEKRGEEDANDQRRMSEQDGVPTRIRSESGSTDVFYDAEEGNELNFPEQSTEEVRQRPQRKEKRLSLDLMLKERMDMKTPETLALEEIRVKFGEHGFSDALFCRFLRARHWDVEKTTLLLNKYIDWREKMQPDKMCWGDVEEEFRTGKLYRLDTEDFDGRQVVVLRPGRQNTNSHDQQLRMLVYTMESAIALKGPEDANVRMRAAPIRTPPREQLVILLDFTGYTLFNAPPFKTSLETLKILQDCYCERLGEALLLNPPTVFRVLWKLLRPFIDPRTLKKINILPKNFECCEVLSERFDLDALDTSLGGRGDFPYNHEEYAEVMKAEDERRRASRTV
mmetsp:Transcript_9414/g.24172  ORF Transcript_9414/g.24172 Transcript_9414/m.24172 type:complete len:383 (-) Transcript_9414:110-1258(-)